MLNADAKAFSVAIKTQKQPFLGLNKTPWDQSGQWLRVLSKGFLSIFFEIYLSGVNKHNQMFNPLVKMDHFIRLNTFLWLSSYQAVYKRVDSI